MKRTNIMLTDEQHGRLKSYSRNEKKTLGELVRDALDVAYKTKDIIEHRRAVALEAYREGFISIGKLSEALGVDIISTRLYLKEKNILLNTQEQQEVEQDAVNA